MNYLLMEWHYFDQQAFEANQLLTPPLAIDLIAMCTLASASKTLIPCRPASVAFQVPAKN